MNFNQEQFGVLSDGTIISKFTVSNKSMSFSAINYGCIITSIITPDKSGQGADIALGFDTLAEYVEKNDKYFGAIVGRYANRISNATFSVEKRSYQLDKNDGENCLHGGYNGYNKMVWNATSTKDERGIGVKFSRTSASGEQGFPGTVKFDITYMLTDNNEIICEYTGVTSEKTPISLTNHTYFNLKGAGTGKILGHIISIDSDKYLPVNESLIPTGELASVENTPFDLQQAQKISEKIGATNGGYDTCFVLSGNVAKPCVKVIEPISGRTLEVFTNQPGIQFYTGNFLDGVLGKCGKPYGKQEGFCLETQQFPDAPNKITFPNCFADEHNDYRAITIFKFSA